jgi:hypothetical protein
MPGLVRGIARTAVVAGTATAVSGRVQRRQAEKFADRDAQIATDREAAYEQQQGPPPQPVYEQAPPPSGGDVVQQLKDLAELKNQGMLTDEEFAAQKTRVLAHRSPALGEASGVRVIPCGRCGAAPSGGHW